MDAGSRRGRALKGCAIGCGLLVLLGATGALLVGRIISEQAREPEITAWHPFRSPAAKERFLARYDQRGGAWPVASRNRLVDTSWGETFVRVSGRPDAPPLVLLPGVGGSSLQWMPNVAALSASRRVYAVDTIYDIGRSVYRKRLRTSADFVSWLDEVLLALGLEDDVALAGLSYGGWIASQYALEHPERIERLVLLAPAGTVLNLSSGFLKRAILAAIPLRLFSRNLIHWLAADSVAAGGDIRRELDAAIEDGYIGQRTFAFRQMVAPTVLSDEQLGSFTMPVLFLVGENEKIYSPMDAVERLHRAAPGIRTQIVSGAGHDLTLVRADEVNALMLDFLNEALPR